MWPESEQPPGDHLPAADRAAGTPEPVSGAAAITRGTLRLLLDLGYCPATEITLANGRRVDILAVGRAGELTIVEVKASVPDFQSDRKWPEYLPFCDRFYFAVDAAFPTGLIPESCGLMVADGYGAAILREAAAAPLAAARRKAVTLRLARIAAERLARQMLPFPPP